VCVCFHKLKSDPLGLELRTQSMYVGVHVCVCVVYVCVYVCVHPSVRTCVCVCVCVGAYVVHSSYIPAI